MTFDPPPEWDRVGHAETLAWWEERHRTHAGFDAVGYAGAGEAYNAWLYRLRRRLFRRHVAPLARRGAAVLDVGAGTGFYLERWREAGVRDLTAADVSETAVGRLRERFPGVRVLRFDLAGPPDDLPPRRFDVVSAFDVLFHVVDDAGHRAALANLARLVRPGGTLVATENFRRAGPRRYASVQVNREEGELLASLRAAGFEVMDRHPMFVLMNAPIRGDRPRLDDWWQRVHRLLTTRSRAGHVLGPALYPVELAALAVARDAPSTELVVCRRVAE